MAVYDLFASVSHHGFQNMGQRLRPVLPEYQYKPRPRLRVLHTPQVRSAPMKGFQHFYTSPTPIPRTIGARDTAPSRSLWQVVFYRAAVGSLGMQAVLE